MVKKYSCREFTIEAEYTPSLTYVGALYNHFSVSTLKITNTSGRDWGKMTVAVTGDYVGTQIRVHDGVANGATVKITPDGMKPDMERLQRVETSRSSELRVAVSGDDETFDVVTLPIKVYSRNHFAGEAGHFEELAAFVDPAHELAERIAGVVENNGNTTGATDEFTALRGLVKGVYDAVKDLEIDYRDVFFRADKGQDINTFDLIEKEQRGNGLDIALLLCACIERLGVRSSLIYFNSSVIVGAWVHDAPAAEIPVVSEAENIYSLIAADKPLLVLVDPAGIATGKDFEDANYSANKLLLGEEPSYLIDIQASRKAGVKPLAAAPKKVDAVQDKPAEAAEDNHTGIFKWLADRNQALTANMAGSGQIVPACADSFATRAITEADSGVSFILDAPAGTGRDAVVASIIANASAKGRRVKYVAADEEIKERVRRCLEDATDGACGYRPLNSSDKEAQSQRMESAHRTDADGPSVNDVIEKYYAIDGDEMRLSVSKASKLDESEAEEIADTLESLDDSVRMLGKHPSQLPLTGIYPRVKTSRGQARIEAFLEEFPRFEKRVRRRERGLLNRLLFHHDAMHYLERIEQWNTFRRLVVLDDKLTTDIDTISKAVSRWYANRHLFVDWAPYAETVATLNRLGAFDLLDYFLSGKSGKATADAFLKGYYKARATHSIKKGGKQPDHSQEEDKAETTDMKMLLADMGKVELFTLDQLDGVNNGDAADVVIIDEAGRIATKELYTIVTADTQLILAGDAVLADRTSALAAAAESGLPEYSLKFLISQRHERLAAFRNKTFYGGNLFTFPSADDRRPVVRHIDPTGCFDADSGTNEVEAEAVIEILTKILIDNDEKAPTVGVVAFTQAQCELIDRLWKWHSGSRRPLFIKTPEAMTGAEVCDALVISVTYAPDNTGRVRAAFGCFDGRNGDKIINRMISPARREMTVVSSLRPPHIPEDEVMPFGVRVLRRFIAYAIDPYRPLRGEDAKPDVTATVKSVADELMARGCEVATNVGEGPFKVDIAVKDPADSERYLFGVLVDSKSSDALPTETDRDVVVPGILSDLGWDIKHVRAVDWFSDRNGVMSRLLSEAE